MHATLPLLEISDFPSLRRETLKTLQVNLGYRCNQRCLHCHVNAGPTRTEMMTDDVLDLVPKVLQAQNIQTLDLTGGAPELHSGFRALVARTRAMGIQVLDRCNLTVMFEPGQHDLADFLADHDVGIVASLPCYSADNVDKQRGDGVFDKSIAALRMLNALGYGQDHPVRRLDLVYNPIGASLPPEQSALEVAYKRELFDRFGVRFDRLLALANMPIKRFGSTLISQGNFETYMNLLKAHHRAANLPGVMCRTTVSVDWQGFLYDCDFNQQLELPLPLRDRGVPRAHLRDLLTQDIKGEFIRVAEHCYGCTAGQGSSCGGALAGATK